MRLTPVLLLYIVFLWIPGFALPANELWKQNPERRAGDNAFSARDYAVAASFYQKYLTEALQAGDPAMEKDARERVLDALVMGGMTGAAEENLKEYRKKYPSANPTFLQLWQGEIYTGKKQYKEARETYEKLLSSITNPRDPLRIRILFAYGQVLENLREFAGAAKVYENLQSLPLSSELGKNAFVRRLLSLACAGKCKEAEELLLSNPAGNISEKDKEDYRLIHSFILLKKTGAVNNMGLWKTLLPSFAKRPDPLVYLVTSAYGDGFVRENQPSAALDSYRAAFQSATDNSSMSDTLTRIISCVSGMGDKRHAAELAEKQLDLFRDTLVKPENKLALGDLLVRNGKTDSGLLLYDSLLQAMNTPEKLREKAFEKYLLTALATGEKANGIRHLRKIFQTRKEVARGEKLLAEGLKKAGSWQEACDIYLALGTKAPLREKDSLLKGAFLSLEKKDRNMMEKFLAPLRRLALSDKNLAALLPYLEGSSFALSGDHKKALTHFKRFIAAPGSHKDKLPQALYNGAMCAFSAGDMQTAENYLKRLSREYAKTPLGAPASRWLIHLYFTAGKEIAAEREVWLLAERDPKSPHTPQVILQLAKHHGDKGAIEKAGEALAQLFKLTDKKIIQARVLYEQSLLAQKTGKTQKTEALLEQLFREYPNSPILPEALYLRGDVEKSKGNFVKAAQYYGLALDKSKGTLLELAAQGALGDTYFARGQTEPEALRQALISYLTVADSPKAPLTLRAGALCKAGKCRELLGEWEEASLLYKQLLYMTPAKEAANDPAVLPWYVKSAEALIDMALKHPVRSAFENARMALHFLHDASLLTRQEAEKRFETLKRRKFQP